MSGRGPAEVLNFLGIISKSFMSVLTPFLIFGMSPGLQDVGVRVTQEVWKSGLNVENRLSLILLFNVLEDPVNVPRKYLKVFLKSGWKIQRLVDIRDGCGIWQC